MKISELQHDAWVIAEEKGFHDGRTANRDDTLIRLGLVVTEVAEAMQVVKREWGKHPSNHKPAGQVAEELADVLIRCADLAECIDVDLEEAVKAKLAKNRGRPRMYGTPAEEKS